MDAELQASAEMCEVCFDMLISTLENKPTQSIVEDFRARERFASTPCPVFITWQTGPAKDLRGCIGTFDNSQQIGNVVPEYALVSAFQDPRFGPISARELPNLQVSVSLLTNFTPINDPLMWEVGKHGIEIEFRANNRRYSGTFLPEVAEEEGWDQVTTLYQLFRKAGYKPPSGKDVRTVIQELGDNLSVTTYQSSKSSLSYQEYIARKNN